MSDILLHFDRISPTTWAYLSSLLSLALFFKFSRVWSVRNLDLLLLIMLAPGLLMVLSGESIQRAALVQQSTEASPDESSPEPEIDNSLTQVEPAPTPAINLVGFTVVVRDETSPAEIPTATGEENRSDEPDSETSPLFQNIKPPQVYDTELPTTSRTARNSNRSRVEKSAETLRGEAIERGGYYWLFAITAILLIRMLIDSTMVRRPLLEPNLSTGGLTFLACALYVFLMANIISGHPTANDLRGTQAAESLLQRRDTTPQVDGLARNGPGLGILYALPTFSSRAIVGKVEGETTAHQYDFADIATAKAMAILSHLAIVLGIVAIGYFHFQHLRIGIGVATLYLLLPYTAEMTGDVTHTLPAALLTWAVVFYRRPLVAGLFLGMAAGVIYYPLFLLPLWISFYFRRGLGRFLIGFASMILIVAISIIFTSADFASFWLQFAEIFGIRSPELRPEVLDGIWRLAWDPNYRIPMLAAFLALSGSFALWPVQKNLGTLLGASAALMLAAQFWHGHGGGTIMAWYLPLLLLTIFRPNLEDRVAVAVLDEGRWPRLATLGKAA